MGSVFKHDENSLNSYELRDQNAIDEPSERETESTFNINYKVFKNPKTLKEMDQRGNLTDRISNDNDDRGKN